MDGQKTVLTNMEESIEPPIANSDRMLRDALEALSQADSSLLETQIQPYNLADLNTEDSVAVDANKETKSSSNGPLPPQLLPEIHSQEIRIELGRTRLPPEELYELSEKTLLVLESPNQELVDLFTGDTRLARGQILCIDGRIGFRVVELFTQP